MFLRAAAVTALMVGLAGSAGEALAQYMPGPPAASQPPMRPLPPAAVNDDNNLPPYDPPPGYGRAPSGQYGQPYGQPRTYESQALPPPGQSRGQPGQYGAAPGGQVPNYSQGRETVYSPPAGQYGAAPGYPQGPAYGQPPSYGQDQRGASQPQYGAIPPQQPNDQIRPPMAIGPGQGGQPGASDPDVMARLPADDRPETGPRKELPPKFRRTTVDYRTKEPAGTIVIDTANTYLYFVLGNGKAIRYGIGVGREGFTWSGNERVSRMAEWPDWHPPAEMIERQPYLPRFMAGGEGNPLGARALYLGKTLYRIHGTNQPSTIGTFVSSGCIRLTNEDIIDLYHRVKVGTRVVVVKGKPPVTASKPAPAATPVGQGMPQGQYAMPQGQYAVPQGRQQYATPHGQQQYATPYGQQRQAENYGEPVPLQPPAVIHAR